MKKLTMILLTIIMVLGTGNKIKAAEVDTIMDYKNSIFSFNYQYTVTDRPKDSLGEYVTALNTGTIFAIKDGLFITAASNLNKLPGKTYSNEVYFTKFEFESRDFFFSNRTKKLTIYGYYDLLYVNNKTNIAILKGDEFMTKLANPLKLADRDKNLDDYAFLIGYDSTDKKLVNRTAQDILIIENKESIMFDHKFNSDYDGSPIIFAGEVIGVYTNTKLLLTEDNIAVDVYFPNLGGILKAVEIALKK